VTFIGAFLHILVPIDHLKFGLKVGLLQLEAHIFNQQNADF